MALHKPTNTLLVLMQADSGRQQQQQQQQQLVVLDARSLSVLLALGLSEGHCYTCLAVLDLPCTSQQQQQQPGGATASAAEVGAAAAAGGPTSGGGSSSRSGLRPFIVLGSSLNMAVSPHPARAAAAGPAQPSSSASAAAAAAAAATTAPEELQVGMLSFFELRASIPSPGQAADVSAAGQASSAQHEMRYDLLLHGMTPLPVTPACVCTVVPQVLSEHDSKEQAAAAAGSSSGADTSSAAQLQAAAGTEAAGSAAAAGQAPVCLAIGSEEGVSLLQVLIDDAGRAEQVVLQQQLAAAAEVSRTSRVRTYNSGCCTWCLVLFCALLHLLFGSARNACLLDMPAMLELQ
jgi:hypothetical protein